MTENKKYKYYIATRLDKHEDHNLVRDLLEDSGSFEITYDWTTHGPVYHEGAKRCAEVAGLELKGVADADVVIVLLPGGRGTHVEMGAAMALNKVVILLSSEPRKDYYINPETCAFYHYDGTYQWPWNSVTDVGGINFVRELENNMRILRPHGS